MYVQTMETIKLLTILTGCLTNTYDVWASFSAANGDIVYFADTDCSTNGFLQQALQAIKESIDSFQEFRRRLRTLEKACHTSRKTVSCSILLRSTCLLMYIADPSSHTNVDRNGEGHSTL